MHPLARVLQSRLGDRLSKSYWPLYSPPIEPISLEECEQHLGFKIPVILRDIYLYVANGGIGPDSDTMQDGTILRAIKNNTESGFPSIVEVYMFLKQPLKDNKLWVWPNKLLPFCDWGCGMYSCIDCSRSNLPLYLYDSNVQLFDEECAPVILKHTLVFDEWMKLWANKAPLWEEMEALPRPVITPTKTNTSTTDIDDF